MRIPIIEQMIIPISVLHSLRISSTIPAHTAVMPQNFSVIMKASAAVLFDNKKTTKNIIAKAIIATITTNKSILLNSFLFIFLF